ncbi:uncharacterized protein LOC127420962 [Myxocyprinus asiaticus]|uniref:uncharacterized protein LOC127420962 n=1 Tax=Myxocyprinus asiaticus TaxID=70543 RepID=UPI00222278BD|nr:uncharacterized protein LOC127420962 [Myxocyprinus asiaticus]
MKHGSIQVEVTDLPQASLRSIFGMYGKGSTEEDRLLVSQINLEKAPDWFCQSYDNFGHRAVQMTEWLKNNILPPAQAEQYMKETAIHRAKWIRDNGTKGLTEIVSEYPCLLDTPGMISQDFSVLNSDCASKLTENWVPVFKDKILRFARREKQALHLLSDVDTMSADIQSDIALLVFPMVLPTSVHKIGRKMFRPRFIETRKAFIDIQPIGTNMAEYLRCAKNTTEFSYVLMLGDNNQCFQAFVVINGEALEQNTLLAAVDVCCKAFYTLDVNFPKPCSPVWEFLQIVVYGLPGNESPAIRILRAYISHTSV